MCYMWENQVYIILIFLVQIETYRIGAYTNENSFYQIVSAYDTKNIYDLISAIKVP